MALTSKEYQDYYTKYNEKRENTSVVREDIYSLKGLVIGTKSETILDYGSGKGLQYSRDDVSKKFGIKRENVTCYDIGVPEFSILPKGRFDGVVCTDVLEHIPEESLNDNLEAMFAKASKFLYLAIHCGLAAKVLPNGENAHCTVQRPSWWKKRVDALNVNDIPVCINYRIPTNPALDILNLANR